MLRRPVSTLVGALLVVFLLALGVFYLQTGSFAGAGAKMDQTLAEAGDDAADAAGELAENTGEVIEDVADGSDETPG